MDQQPHLIQWNSNGLLRKNSSFKKLINDFNPIIVSIQETKFHSNFVPNFPHYKSYFKNKISQTVSHGGVLTIVSNDFPSEEVLLRTNLQAVAVRVSFPFKHVVCNIYLPGNEPLDKKELDDLVCQLGCNFVIVGDFNAQSSLGL